MQHVYHFYGFAGLFAGETDASGKTRTSKLGGRVADRNFVKALKAVKDRGHPLVLHLAPGERPPTPENPNIFDCVVEVSNASDLSNVPDLKSLQSQIDGFLKQNWEVDITDGEANCSLLYGLMDGLQACQTKYAAGRAFMTKLVQDKADLRLEEYSDAGLLQIVQEPWAGWTRLHKEKGWADRRCIWIDVDARVKARRRPRESLRRSIRLEELSAKKAKGVTKEKRRSNMDLNKSSARKVERVIRREQGRWTMSVKNLSAKEVEGLTRDLMEGRPWVARRSGPKPAQGRL